MEVRIRDLNIYYLEEGKGNDVLILHGWGSSTKVFKGMIEDLRKSHRVIAVDLPGFGNSDEPNNSWNLDDYVSFVYDVIVKLKIKTPTIIGHSFGGRIAIKMGSNKHFKLNKIILIDSAGIKKIKKDSFKTKLLKLLKNTIGKLAPDFAQKMKNKIGSADYKNASPMLKEILVNVISEDLTEYLDKIDYPTLLIWGENDQDTPITDAYIMESKIKDSGVVVVPNAGHYSFLDNPYLVHTVINNFLNGGNNE